MVFGEVGIGDMEFGNQEPGSLDFGIMENGKQVSGMTECLNRIWRWIMEGVFEKIWKKGVG